VICCVLYLAVHVCMSTGGLPYEQRRHRWAGSDFYRVAVALLPTSPALLPRCAVFACCLHWARMGAGAGGDALRAGLSVLLLPSSSLLARVMACLFACANLPSLRYAGAATTLHALRAATAAPRHAPLPVPVRLVCHYVSAPLGTLPHYGILPSNRHDAAGRVRGLLPTGFVRAGSLARMRTRGSLCLFCWWVLVPSIPSAVYQLPFSCLMLLCPYCLVLTSSLSLRLPGACGGLFVRIAWNY